MFKGKLSYSTVKDLWEKCADAFQRSIIQKNHSISKLCEECSSCDDPIIVKGLLSILLFMALDGFFFNLLFI
jgi:hypothetical protein